MDEIPPSPSCNIASFSRNHHCVTTILLHHRPLLSASSIFSWNVRASLSVNFPSASLSLLSVGGGMSSSLLSLSVASSLGSSAFHCGSHSKPMIRLLRVCLQSDCDEFLHGSASRVSISASGTIASSQSLHSHCLGIYYAQPGGSFCPLLLRIA